MKKIILLMFSAVILLSACANTSAVQSTDLSQIRIDDFCVGDTILSVNIDRYTPSDRFPEKENAYNFEEYRLETDGNFITKITASFGNTSVIINGEYDFTSFDDIQNILGKDCEIAWYDKEQKLRRAQYIDIGNNLLCNIVYSDNGSEPVWIILEHMGD